MKADWHRILYLW